MNVKVLPFARHPVGFSWLLFLVICLGATFFVVSPAGTQDANQGQGCIEHFDPAIDYFPHKATLREANGLEIEYHGHYKIARVLQPWPGADRPLEYLLLQCGAPAPPEHADMRMVEVPVRRVISLTSSQLPNLRDLGRLDSLVAVDNGNYINAPEVRALLAEGAIAEIGSGASVNIELALELAPDLVLANGFNPETDAHPALEAAGVFTAINADWLEPTLTGRAEWLKFVALFFNEEARAETLYDEILGAYETTTALVAELAPEERTFVLMNTFSPWSEAWVIPGQTSWVGRLLRDAGADWVLMETVPAEVNGLVDFETVFATGRDAPLWIVNHFLLKSREELLAEDERYAEFAALQSGAVYNSNARENGFGGSDFWETGVSRPHLLLLDLVKIFHPGLLPRHELLFYRRLS